MKAKKVVYTHDENKEAKELVKFTNYDEIGKELDHQFLFIEELGKDFQL